MKAAISRLRRFNPEQRTNLLVSQCVDVSIRTLPDVTEALMQIVQNPLPANVFELVVQYNALKVTKTADFAIACATNEQIVLPSRKLIAGVKHDSRGSNGRHPNDLGNFHAFFIRKNARAVILAAETNHRPAVVGAGFDQVHFIAAIGPVFSVENRAGGMNDQTEMVAMAERINLRAIAWFADKRVVARNAAVVVQAKNLAVRAHGVLRFLNLAGGGRGHQNSAVLSKGQTRAAYVGPLLCAVEFLDLR